MIWIVVSIVILVIIILLFATRSTTNEPAEYSINSMQYYVEIEKALSDAEQQVFRAQVEQIKSIEALVIQKNKDLSRVTHQAEAEIERRTCAAENEIKKRWRNSTSNYYQCLALHYQSFTLANIIHSDKDMLITVRGTLSENIRTLSAEIETLQDRIDRKAASPADFQRIKKLRGIRKDFITKRNHLRDITDEKMHMLNAQNALTAERRDYIATHFGNRGRQWAKRMKQRHS